MKRIVALRLADLWEGGEAYVRSSQRAWFDRSCGKLWSSSDLLSKKRKPTVAQVASMPYFLKSLGSVGITSRTPRRLSR